MTDAPAMPVLIAGLDLGQTADPSALVVLDRTFPPVTALQGRPLATYGVRHARRWPLGTSYAAVVADVCGLFAAPPLAGSLLAIDLTGVGRPVMDMLRAAGPNARLVPVTITAGRSAAVVDGTWRVPKAELVSVVRSLLGLRRLRIAPALPEAEALACELADFRVNITGAGNETFAARPGTHDDILMALAVAAWAGEHGPGPGRRLAVGGRR